LKTPLVANADVPTVKVWALSVRLAHWTLAVSVVSCLWLHEGGPWHERLGYLALAVLLWRMALGVLTRAPLLRWSGFVRGPRATWAYGRAWARGREVRHLGHNPLGAWMIVALVTCGLVAAGSGALYATNGFWGDETVYAVHRISAWAFAVLVPLHVGGVVLASWRHRENLLLAMLDGKKRAPAPGDLGAP
jgi:cytochrome b